MSLTALLLALALAYYWPLPRADWLHQLFAPYAAWLERNFNDGQERHGIIAALIATLLPALVIAIVYLSLTAVNLLFGVLCAAGILYLTLRFGRFGAPAERIASALRANNIEGARAELAVWQSCQANDYGEREVARVGIEATLRHAHHDLFAPLFWFLLLGPAGALLYRLSYLLTHAWEHQHPTFRRFSQRLFDWLDWLPSRFTGVSFAVVGDFEDAVYCWRTQAQLWPNAAIGIILASGAGAMGVRLGEPLVSNGTLQYRPELGLGDDADADYLQSAVGLIWRVLALMAGLLLLLTFARWLGN